VAALILSVYENLAGARLHRVPLAGARLHRVPYATIIYGAYYITNMHLRKPLAGARLHRVPYATIIYGAYYITNMHLRKRSQETETSLPRDAIARERGCFNNARKDFVKI
jgi:hypothetical protein